MNTKITWKVTLSFIALFLLGGLSGASLLRVAQSAAHPAANLERDWAQREEQSLEKRLKLRPEQIAQLKPILAETANKMRQVKLETARQLAETMKQNSGQVVRLLDEEQKTEFERLIKERQAKVAKTLDPAKAP